MLSSALAVQMNGFGSVFPYSAQVGAGVAFAQVGEDVPGGQVHGREQIDGAVALVPVSHRVSSTTFDGQCGPGAVQRWHWVFYRNWTPPPAGD